MINVHGCVECTLQFNSWRIDVCVLARTQAQDPRKLYWDFFIGMMIVYSMVVIPWRISFGQDASGGMLIFDYIVDGIFSIDILLCFNAAYFEEVGVNTSV